MCVCDFENQIDPNNNFFASLNKKCDYYTESEFNKENLCSDNLSIIHVNCRSLKANFTAFKRCIEQLNGTFDIIAVSETWLTGVDQIDDYMLQNYNLAHVDRLNKRGGGVLIYVSTNYQFDKVANMSFAINDVMEVVTVELSINHKKNIIVSCVYRTPCSNVGDFNDYISELLDKVKCGKSHIFCGDFNINMLNYNTHKGTKTFVDIMFNNGLFPLINLTTRASSESSTLIDNIFCNILDNSNSGVLVNDTISDHLPIFSQINYQGTKGSSTSINM